MKTSLKHYLLDVWLPRKKNELKVSTYTRYEGLSKRIITQLGKLSVDKVKPNDIYGFYNYLYEVETEQTVYSPNNNCINLLTIKGRGSLKVYQYSTVMKNNNVTEKTAKAISEYLNLGVEVLFYRKAKHLSDRTISHYHKILFGVFKDAIYDGVCKDNVMNKVRPPRISDSKEPICLDEATCTEVIKHLKAYAVYPFREILLLIIYTGLRRGEACGLEWGDIDYKNETITVRRASYYLPKRGIYTDDLKTKKAYRSISFDKKVLKILTDVMNIQKTILSEDNINSRTRLFTNADGSLLNPNSVTKYYHNFIQTYDLPKSTVHSLRHTNASLMIAAGVPITTISARLGHSNSEITLRCYAHQLSSENKKAAKAIEKMI